MSSRISLPYRERFRCPMMGWGPYPIRLVAVARLAINLSTVRGVGDKPYDFDHGSPLFSPGDKSSPARALRLWSRTRGYLVWWWRTASVWRRPAGPRRDCVPFTLRWSDARWRWPETHGLDKGWVGGRDGEQNVQPQQSVIRRAGVAMNERPRVSVFQGME